MYTSILEIQEKFLLHFKSKSNFKKGTGVYTPVPFLKKTHKITIRRIIMYILTVTYNFDADYICIPFLKEKDAVKKLKKILKDEVKTVRKESGYEPSVITDSETDVILIYAENVRLYNSDGVRTNEDMAFYKIMDVVDNKMLCLADIAPEDAKYEQKVFGDYVLTPCRNAFNNKYSCWLTKKDMTVSMYCFTVIPRIATYEEELKNIDSYIRGFQRKFESNE